MNPVHISSKRAVLRALGGAAVSACLVASIGLVSSSAAEPPRADAAARDAGAMNGTHEGMGQRWAQHVQAHLDKLAERLEIKASQEAAWQKFSAAFRNNMSLHAMMGHADGHEPADADAAALARQQADRAWDHAQKLTQLADATAALQQALAPEQRLVFDEAARRFAREHGGHGSIGPMAGGGHYGAREEHCERDADGEGEGHGGYAHPHGHGEQDDDPHGSMMESPHHAHGTQGESAH